MHITFICGIAGSLVEHSFSYKGRWAHIEPFCGRTNIPFLLIGIYHIFVLNAF